MTVSGEHSVTISLRYRHYPDRIASPFFQGSADIYRADLDKLSVALSIIKKDGEYYFFSSKASGWYPSQTVYTSDIVNVHQNNSAMWADGIYEFTAFGTPLQE